MSFQLGLKQLTDPRRGEFAKMVITDEMLAKPMPAAYGYSYLYPAIDNQGNIGDCFKRGTLITMADGSLKPIEHVKLLDEVISAEGNPQHVEVTMARYYEGDIYGIKVWGNNLLECTKEHPILTKRGYVAAKQITLDDWVAIPRVNPSKRNRFLDTMEFLSEKDYKKYKGGTRKTNKLRGGSVSNGSTTVVGTNTIAVTQPPKLLELTEELGYLFGLYLAEGSTDYGRISWHFALAEEHTLVKQTVELCKKLLNVEPTLQYRRANNVITVRVHGMLWQKLFSQLFGEGAKNKALHARLTSGNVQFLKGMLDGWLAGDGHVRGRRKTGVSISHNLALTMFTIANSLGYNPNIRKSKPSSNCHAKTRQDRYDVEFVTDIAQSSVWKGKCYFDEHTMWSKVRSIETTPFSGYVYNLQVSSDNSYIAEGVGVHNCVAYGNAKVFETYHHKRVGSPLTISRRALFSEIKHTFYPNDLTDDGAQVSDGIKILEQHYVLEKDWDEELNDFSRVMQVVPDSLKHTDFQFKNFVAVQPDVQSLKLALLHHGPILLGVDWPNAWMNVGSDGRMPAYDISAGGHCVSLADYYDGFVNLDGSKGAFYGPNNWGTDVWGKKGWFYLPYNQVSHIMDAFTVAA